MNSNSTRIAVSEPLHVVLRRRREQLQLLQADVAEALHVSPECVTLWEGGRRRPELSKLPRIAEALQLDAEDLCRKALAEFHPPVYETLFGDGSSADGSTDTPLHALRRSAVSVAARNRSKSLAAACESS